MDQPTIMIGKKEQTLPKAKHLRTTVNTNQFKELLDNAEKTTMYHTSPMFQVRFPVEEIIFNWSLLPD